MSASKTIVPNLEVEAPTRNISETINRIRKKTKTFLLHKILFPD